MTAGPVSAEALLLIDFMRWYDRVVGPPIGPSPEEAARDYLAERGRPAVDSIHVTVAELALLLPAIGQSLYMDSGNVLTPDPLDLAETIALALQTNLAHPFTTAPNDDPNDEPYYPASGVCGACWSVGLISGPSQHPATPK